MTATAVEIENLGKRYLLSHQRRPDSLKKWLRDLVLPEQKQGQDEEFWALQHVSLNLGEGECLALVGKNGSGKSTLLKILARVLRPSTGRIRVRGRVASLLEVGTAFHPELTGRENIFLNGVVLGCPASVIRARLDSIVDFSGVERFLDTCVKHYSTGMFVRLAYAVAAHVDADILVIDEVLAVGDAEFERKCHAHLATQIAQGKSAIVVSHDIATVRRLATHAAWLENGRVREFRAPAAGVLDHYEQSSAGGP
jgi:lipopolysaccharide transport system ATP-binding protein